MGVAHGGSEPDARPPLWRAVVLAGCVVAVGMVAATLVLRITNGGQEPEGRNWWMAIGLFLGLAYLPIGLLVLVRSQQRAVGVLLAVAGAGAALGALAAGYAAAAVDAPSLPGGGIAGSASGPLWLVGITALAVALPAVLAPVGEHARRRWYLLAGALAGLAVALPYEAVKDPAWSVPSPDGPFGSAARTSWLRDAAQAGRWTLAAVATAAVALGIAARWRDRRAGDDHALRAWVAVGFTVAWLTVPPLLIAPIGSDAPGETVVLPLVLLATVPLVGVGLLTVASRDWTWTSDAAAHRLLEWVLLTGAIAVLYTVVVAGLGALVGGSGPTWLLVAATGAVAATAEPLRRWTRSLVDHLLYGERQDPLAVVHAVMQQVSSMADVDALLPALAETVAAALRLDHVRIDVAGSGGRQVGGVHGHATEQQEEIELRHHGVLVGWLVVGWTSGSSLRRGDRASLHDAAVQLAHAVGWVRLTDDLRRALVAIASAREEERRRLRRDLHDGLGPALTGISLGVRSAVKELERQPGTEAPTSLLSILADEIDATVAEVKRITRDLHPTALDERDLCAAIGAFARRLDPVVNVHLDLPATCPKLPAAVEVATYRITSEALTNVVRHARAANCWVEMVVDGSVEIDVRDDGVGMPAGAPRGVGLEAMNERVAELGGTLAVRRNGDTGTHLHVSLPATGR